MITSITNALTQLVMALPVPLAIMVLLTCVILAFFVICLRKRDALKVEDKVSAAKRKDMTMLACIGVDLLVIAYLGVVFFLFQFLVDHVELLR